MRYILKYYGRNAQGQGYWENLDLGEATPALTYQINTITELKDRQATFSQNIALPNSLHNRRVLGFPENIMIKNPDIYNPRPCRLFCDGFNIVPFGATLSILSTTPAAINVQIVSANKDVFDLLKLATLSSDQRIPWAANSIKGQYYEGWTDFDLKWPIIKPWIGLPYNAELLPRKGIVPAPTLQIEARDTQEMFPAIKFIELVKYCLKQIGYILKGDILNHENIDNDYVLCGKLQDERLSNGGQPSGPSATWGVNGQSLPLNGSNINVPLLSENEYDLAFVRDSSRVCGFYAPCTCKVRLKIQIRSPQPLTESGDYVVKILLKHQPLPKVYYDKIAPTTVDSSALVTIDGGDGFHYFEHEYEVDLGVNDIVYWSFTSEESTAESIPVNVWCDLTVPYDLNDDKTYVGSYVDLIEGTGFTSRYDIVKSFIQAYGLIVDVKRTAEGEGGPDNIIGEVSMYSFNELYRRKEAGQFKDWSNKFVLYKDKTSYRINGYGQKNIINAKATGDITDEGSFVINDKSLTSEQVLFTLPFVAGKSAIPPELSILDVTERTVPVDFSPLRPIIVDNIVDIQTPLGTYTGGNGPYLLTLSGMTKPIAISQGTLRERIGNNADDLPGLVLSLPVAEIRSVRDLVNNYYSTIKGLLDNAKIIEVELNLTTLDIHELDFLTPVFIRHFGAYFYISKISNFRAGQLTKCELIKL